MPRKRISAWKWWLHVPRAVIVAKGETAGQVLAEGAEALADALTDRLERLEAIGAAAGVKANAFGRAMIDRDEHRRWPSPVTTVVRSVPHMRSTRSVVMVPAWAREPRPARALMRQQAVLAHQPQDAAPAGADAGKRVAPIACGSLAVERAVLQELPNRRTSSSSAIAPSGPGRRRAIAVGWRRWRYTVARDTPQIRVTRCRP